MNCVIIDLVEQSKAQKMKSNLVLTAKVLLVHALELNEEIGEENGEYSFNVYEFSNGLILVPGETTNDWFFEDRNTIEANGTAIVSHIEETGDEREFTSESLLRSIQGSISEFGIDSVPRKHSELWKGKKTKPDKQLLEAEIKRLGASSMVVIEDSDAPNGLEIHENDNSWCSTGLNVSATLANWSQLPDNVGSHEAWRKLVDTDWSLQLNQNAGVD